MERACPVKDGLFYFMGSICWYLCKHIHIDKFDNILKNKKLFLFPVLLIFISHTFLFAQDKPVKAPDDGDGTKSVLCGGVERWAVKVLTDAAAAQVNYTPKLTTLDSLIHIPTTPDQNAPRMAGIEFQSYVFTCNITIKKNEDDNDYHLVLLSGSETMIGEVPDPVCSAAASSAHVNEFIAARNWVNQHIGTNAVPNVNIAPVNITGVSFVDPPHGQTGRAPNGMEIHPILNIQFSALTGLDEGNVPSFKVTVSPSIFSESTNFHVSSEHEMFGVVRLEVFSVSGIRVRDLDIPVTSRKEINYTFSRNGLTGGMYIYRIRNNGSILYEGKIIIQ